MIAITTSSSIKVKRLFMRLFPVTVKYMIDISIIHVNYSIRYLSCKVKSGEINMMFFSGREQRVSDKIPAPDFNVETGISGAST